MSGKGREEQTEVKLKVHLNCIAARGPHTSFSSRCSSVVSPEEFSEIKRELAEVIQLKALQYLCYSTGGSSVTMKKSA